MLLARGPLVLPVLLIALAITVAFIASLLMKGSTNVPLIAAVEHL